MKTKKFSLSQVILFCGVSILLVLGAEWIAWRAGCKQYVRSVLVSAGLLRKGGEKTVLQQDQPNRTTVLNELVKKYGYNSYLEIGQGDRTANFDKVNCTIKIGVDPDRTLNAAYQMTSDEFFSINHNSFDLIFIDGLHHAAQAERDIINSLGVLNENGAIVVHDCNPVSKEMQDVPRIHQENWTGDVWKAWVKLRAMRDDLKMYVVNIDYGCGIIKKGTQELITIPKILTYETLDDNRERLLNLVDYDTFLQDLWNESSSQDNYLTSDGFRDGSLISKTFY